KKAASDAITGAIRLRWRRCWPCLIPPSTCARDSRSPFYNASRQRSATPRRPSLCSKPNANSSRTCGSLRKGGGNDGGCKTLRVSHPPWKSLRHSHIPTARSLLYIFPKTYSRKEPSSPPVPSRFRLILRLEKTAPSHSPSAAEDRQRASPSTFLSGIIGLRFIQRRLAGAGFPPILENRAISDLRARVVPRRNHPQRGSGSVPLLLRAGAGRLAQS